jgi:septal ring factor EnvC (AmiA/AmiB activator)
MLAVRDADDPTMNRSIPCLCLLLLAGPVHVPDVAAAPVGTADSAQATAKLAALRARIAALTARLGGELQERDGLAARLRDAELTITTKRRDLQSLRNEQAAVERRRAALLAEQSRDQSALDAERAALGAQVRAAYLLGDREPLRLLLNQTDPASVARMLTYYGYFVRARSAQIDEIRMRVSRVQQRVVELGETGRKLQALQAAALTAMNGLQQARDARLTALAAVGRRVASGTAELEQLQREEQAEEALLADLARVLQDLPADPQQSFDAMRGRLPWPVPGRMNSGQSGLRRNGVLIDTMRGSKVRAPYYGRVVYADWLQGLGLLLIIGHSGGYMTLYGHAEVLYKSVGDWVAPGDVIAALGDTGGATTQLYFEIRDGRKVVDPRQWLKSAP